MVYVGVLLATGAASYPVLRFLGTRTGKLARPSRRRESIAQKNIELCFPTLSRKKGKTDRRDAPLGMALLETAWPHCPNRVRKWFDAWTGRDTYPCAGAKIAAMVVGVHFMSLELGVPGNGSRR